LGQGASQFSIETFNESQMRSQATVEDASDADMSDDAATPEEFSSPGSQRESTAENTSGLLTEKDVQDYTAAMKWQEVYQDGHLPRASGERGMQRIVRAGKVEAMLSAYDDLTSALAKRPLDPALCAYIRKKIQDISDDEFQCAKLEQEAWGKYVEDPAESGRLAKLREYMKYFVVEHQLCGLPPSKKSDELLEHARRCFPEKSLAYNMVTKLLSRYRDKDWNLIGSTTQ
jgi:hypothetical protein